jgi:hypothetical protein
MVLSDFHLRRDELEVFANKFPGITGQQILYWHRWIEDNYEIVRDRVKLVLRQNESDEFSIN